jgi:uncharacterized protein
VTAALSQIVRHPIKSVGYEELPAATLAPEAPLPWDRHWAVAHAAARFDGNPDGWAPKLNFLRGWGSADLMAVACRFDDGEGRMHLTQPRRDPLDFAPGRDDAVLIDWLRPLWPENRPEPDRLVVANGFHLADTPDPYLAVLNHASNRALGQRLGMDLSIHRWRGNLWVDGWAPWEEFDLIGREIAIGPAVLKVESRITRCKATCGNPETGHADADTLGALRDGYEHEDFGVYARVITGGQLRPGDTVRVR